MWGGITAVFNAPANRRRRRSTRRPVGPDREEFAAALGAQTVAVAAEQRLQRLVEGRAERVDRLARHAVGAAERLGDDPLDDPEAQQVLRRQPQRLGRV